MLKREVGQHVVINPYYGTTGTIIDTKEITTYKDYIKNYDYRVKWNQKMEDGTEWQYFNEDELDMLENNWNMVKSNKSIISLKTLF